MNYPDLLATEIKTVSENLPAMVAGTIYTGRLNASPILNGVGTNVGGYNTAREQFNTSLVFTGGVFVAEKETAEEITAASDNGDYFVNYLTGYYKVKAGASATPAVSYDVLALKSLSDIRFPAIPVTSILPRPSGTSLAAGDVLGTNIVVSGATGNAVPLVLVCTAHGLTINTFYRGTCSGLVGNTAGNGDFAFKPTDADHIAVYQQDEVTAVVGNGAWASGGAIALIHYFKNIFANAGGQADIFKLRVRIETNAAITTTLKLYFYKTQPTATLDDSIKPDLKANELKSLGFAPVLVENVFPSGSDVVLACDATISFPIYADANSKDSFMQIVTNSAIILQASKSVFVELTAGQRQ